MPRADCSHECDEDAVHRYVRKQQNQHNRRRRQIQAPVLWIRPRVGWVVLFSWPAFKSIPLSVRVVNESGMSRKQFHYTSAQNRYLDFIMRYSDLRLIPFKESSSPYGKHAIIRTLRCGIRTL